jgi:hypothetical protein
MRPHFWIAREFATRDPKKNECKAIATGRFRAVPLHVQATVFAGLVNLRVSHLTPPVVELYLITNDGLHSALRDASLCVAFELIPSNHSYSSARFKAGSCDTEGGMHVEPSQ